MGGGGGESWDTGTARVATWTTRSTSYHILGTRLSFVPRLPIKSHESRVKEPLRSLASPSPGPSPKRNMVEAAEVQVPCADFPASLTYFTDHLGFKVKLISPADDPTVAVVQGNGLVLRLDGAAEGPAPLLRFTKRTCDSANDVSTTAPPKGIRIEWVEKTTELIVPDLVSSFVLTCKGDGTDWVEGRAGMLYRDLVPDRQGGRFICSHIRISGGGEVPDYVHHHHVRFQMIYCFKGQVEVVYEDQGPPFLMKAGDCVLQPPHIRHRVLSSSPGLEVIEISCPAQHDTLGDPDLVLPTATVQSDRLFSGQRFVRYQGDQSQWQPLKQSQQWNQSNTGLDVATAGLAGARILRSPSSAQDAGLDLESVSEFIFRFVLKGSVDLQVQEGEKSVVKRSLCEGDAFVIPGSMAGRLTRPVPDTQILEVSLPALAT